MGAKVFRDFLNRLLVGATKSICPIVDGHPAHRTRLVKEFVAAQAEMLEICYSTQRNPDEVVGAHVKREVLGRLVQSMEGMWPSALGALRRIQKLSVLGSSFFHQSERHYIYA